MVRVLACAAAAMLGLGWSTAPEEKPPLRMLFIGNSLTSWNDNLPAYVQAIARARGDRTLTYRMIAPPGVSLEDHWVIPRTQRALDEERWDVVVMQQGPSASVEGRAHLCRWVQRFAERSRARGARPYLLGVWSAGRFGLPEVIESYGAAAAAANVPMLPAGTAWRAVWRRNGRIQLHARDGLHPSRLGTYLTAVVVYAGLRDVSPLSLPRSLLVAKIRFTVKRRTADVLRSAAAQALATPPPTAPC